MTVIAGPCVIEPLDSGEYSLDSGLVFEVAEELKRQLSGEISSGEIELYFKASFDKANRSSIEGFRGPGLERGLTILAQVKARTGLPVLTDFHTPAQAERVAEFVDYLQIPAFLCRQTDMILEGASQALRKGRRLNIKKGQFLSPEDARNIVEKVREVERLEGLTPSRVDWLTLTERGTTFGYQTLVVDMTSFETMRRFGVPVIHDATHSVQKPGAQGKSTGGRREFIEILSRAAFASGADGLFLECHPRPAQAKSDGPNAFHLAQVGDFVRQLLALRKQLRATPYLLKETRDWISDSKGTAL
jgi:2-dehydro-3-deoxyphosphooctonate aldolase (KDO 8-P synthase)